MLEKLEFIQKIFRKNRPAIIVILSFLSVYLFWGLFPVFFEALNNRASDQLMRLRYFLKGSEQISQNLLHIAIDDETEDELSLSFQDRTIYGRIIGLLKQAEVRTIGCDIFFKQTSADAGDTGLLTAVKGLDHLFFPAIPGVDFLEQESGRGHSTEGSPMLPAGTVWYPQVLNSGRVPIVDSLVLPFRELLDKVGGVGHIACFPDNDGRNRRFPLLLRYQDGFIPSLPLKLVCDYLNVHHRSIEVKFGDYLLLKEAVVFEDIKQDIKIPIDAQGRMLINYAGPWQDSYHHFPAHYLLLADEIKASHALQAAAVDSLVLISDITTSSKDYRTEIFDRNYPQSGILLSILNSILTKNFLYTPGILEQIIFNTMFASLIAFLSIRLSYTRFVIISLILFVGGLVVGALLYIYLGRIYYPVPWTLVYVFILGANSINQLFVQQQQKIQLQVDLAMLRELDTAKTHFFQNITHEFKTPLSIIHSCLNDLIQKKCGHTIDTGHPYLKIMQKNNNRVLMLVENLLNFAVLKAGKKDLQPQLTDLSTLLAFYTAELESTVTMRNLDMSFVATGKGKALVLVDRFLFELAFFNLISNALKFTPSGGKVTVELASRGNEYIVSVSDTGVGIPEDKLDSVFNRYESDSGSGIGLALVREVISLHSGIVTVRSTPGKGSCFTLCLPRAKNIQAEDVSELKPPGWVNSWVIPPDETTTANDESALEKKLILIVEDNEPLVEFYSAILSETYRLTWANEGKEALNRLAQGCCPALILCDLVMPGMNGRQFFTSLMTNPVYRDIPVIFITGKNSSLEKADLLEQGAMDYIVKPFLVDELKYKIKNVLEREQKLQRNYDERLLNIMTGAFAQITNNHDSRQNDNLLSIMLKLKKYNITSREKEILALIKEGASNKEIAAKLYVSDRTVGNHIQEIFRKTGVTNRIALVNKLYLEK